MLSFVLTGGQVADTIMLPVVYDQVTVQGSVGRPRTRPQRVLADKGYPSKANRSYLRSRGIATTIPERADQIAHRRKRRGRPIDFGAEQYQRYRGRNVVERCFNRLKQWRGVATRCDKTAGSYHAGVCLAATLDWMKSAPFSNTPYGAGPGQGTEYDGDYGLSTAELAAWHRRRIEILADTPADVLLAETVPSIREVEALAGELDRVGRPALLSVTVAAGRDGVLSDGTDLAEVAAVASGSSAIRAVGVNCGSAGDVLAGVRRLAEFTDLPLIAYPNSGETWDHVNRVWVPRSSEGPGLLESVPDLLDAGVHVIGGCCRVTPREITALRELVSAH